MKHVKLGVLLTASIVAIGAAAVMSIAFATDGESRDREFGRAIGEARRTETDAVFIVVNGVEITQAEIAERVAFLERNRESTMREINSGIYDEESVGTMQRYVALDDAHGKYTVAVAGLVRDAALFAHARDLGLSASDQEIADRVKAQREWVDAVRRSDDSRASLALFEGYLDVVGEQRYWEELLPGWTGRVVTVQKLQDRVTSQAEPDQALRVWFAFGLERVQEADIEIDEAETRTSIEKVLEYLEEGVALDIASIR